VLPLLSLISRARVTSRENIPDGGYIAAANHPSDLDALFVVLALRRRVRFMAKLDGTRSLYAPCAGRRCAASSERRCASRPTHAPPASGLRERLSASSTQSVALR